MGPHDTPCPDCEDGIALYRDGDGSERHDTCDTCKGDGVVECDPGECPQCIATNKGE